MYHYFILGVLIGKNSYDIDVSILIDGRVCAHSPNVQGNGFYLGLTATAVFTRAHLAFTLSMQGNVFPSTAYC